MGWLLSRIGMPRDFKILMALSQPAAGRKFIWILRIYRTVSKCDNDGSSNSLLGHRAIDSEEQGKDF